MAIKKFLKDMFVVEYEEDVPAETQEPEKKKPGANPKVTSFEQSAKKRPAPVETEKDGNKKGPELQEGKDKKMSEGIRSPKRRKSAARLQEKNKRIIRYDKETDLMKAEARNT